MAPWGARVDGWLVRHMAWLAPAVLLAVVASAAATIVWQRTAASATDDRVTLSAAAGEGGTLRGGTPVPPAETLSAPLPALSPPAAAGTLQVAVCAVGWVDARGADGAPDLAAIASAPAVAAAQRSLRQTLAAAAPAGNGVPRPAADGDDGPRALALAVEARAMPSPSPPPSPSSASPDPLQALAVLATTTRDARTYALAWRACAAAEPQAPACASLGIAQWARLDDGNALPWAYALVEAADGRDPASTAARDEALFRIASARRAEERPFAAAAALADIAGRGDLDVLAAWTLGQAVLPPGLSALPSASAKPSRAAPWPAVQQACQGAGGERARSCRQIAELLLGQGDTLLAHRTGLALARGAGLDVAAQEAIADRAEAARAAAATGAWDCARMRADLSRWQAGAAAGEPALYARPAR